MCVNVSITACPDYEPEGVRAALRAVLEPLGGLDWVVPGMKIAVKANLVARMKPESAAATHPVLVTELCRMLAGRGAQVVVGDSPGGPFTAAWVGGIYTGTGMRMVEQAHNGKNPNQSFVCDKRFCKNVNAQNQDDEVDDKLSQRISCVIVVLMVII